jgi:crotonobetainyl-CoA:carnitine CoA-transferase CaiB-like acyl-CoA transferase
VFLDPQVQSQEMSMPLQHPKYGEIKVLGFPMKFKNAPCQIRFHPPDLGENTADILNEVRENT